MAGSRSSLMEHRCSLNDRPRSGLAMNNCSLTSSSEKDIALFPDFGETWPGTVAV